MSMRPRPRPIAWMLLVCALVAAVAHLSLRAGAATRTARGTGMTGACNMANAWGVGAQGGMAHAMSVDNPDGNVGMAIAVARSGC
jgi:hypothetical protein